MRRSKIRKNVPIQAAPITIQPILPQSDLGRWIAHQDWCPLPLDEALANFGYQLRIGKN